MTRARMEGAQDALFSDSRADGNPADGADASRLQRCDGSHWICDDFDHDAGTSRWGAPSLGDAEVSVVGTPTAPSLPNVARARAGSNEQAILEKAGSVDGRGVRCSFSSRAEKRGGTTGFVFFLDVSGAALGVQSSTVRDGENCAFSWAARFVGDGGLAVPLAAAGVYPCSTAWQRVTVEVSGGDAGAVRLSVDGTDIVNASAAALGALAPTSARFAFGMQSYGGADPQWLLDYDDVVCDLVP